MIEDNPELISAEKLFSDLLQMAREGGRFDEINHLLQQILKQENRARLTAETLQQATAALNSSLDLERVLDIILEQLQQVVHYDSASLLLLEGENLYIKAVKDHPQPEAALKVRFSLYEDLLAWEMFSTKKIIILEDAKKDTRYMGRGNADYVRGWMGVPLIARGDVLGILTLDSRTPDAYSEEDAKLAQAFANQAALAVSNARLFQSEHQQRIIAEVLRETSLILSSSLKAEKILEFVLRELNKIVPYDSACIFILEKDQVKIVAHRGYDKFGVQDLLRDFSLPLKETPNLRKMADTRQPYFISDVLSEADWVKKEVSQHIGSWCGAPLVAQDQLLGFLSLDKTDRDYYTFEHADRLQALASHAALALLNSMAYGEMEKASITDYLTGAYNRRYFIQEISIELDHAKRSGHPLSILLLDLDHFKKVNDVYGHLCGDKVLQLVVERLKTELRSIDSLARYGGEEFVVILPGTSAYWMNPLAEKLRLSISAKPFVVELNQNDLIEIALTVSIGGATFPDNGQEPLFLIDCADRALMQAKTQGRNRVVIYE